MLLKQKSSTSLRMSRWLEDGGVRPQTWGDASPSTPASPMEIPWSAWTYDDERLALNPDSSGPCAKTFPVRLFGGAAAREAGERGRKGGGTPPECLPMGRMQVDMFWGRCESKGLLEMPVYAGHPNGGSHAALLPFYVYRVGDCWRQPLQSPSQPIASPYVLCSQKTK
jgi:hypothetical protein